MAAKAFVVFTRLIFRATLHNEPSGNWARGPLKVSSYWQTSVAALSVLDCTGDLEPKVVIPIHSRAEIVESMNENPIVKGIDRRTFVSGVSAASASLVGWRSICSASDADKREAGKGLRAAVLETPDRWTQQSVGVRELLHRCGCETIPLELGKAPQDQSMSVDMVVFGSFTNNAEDYSRYVSKYAKAIQEFVRDGGVVIELTQSDQFGNEVTYLPKPMAVRRCDEDFDEVFVIAKNHPLTSWIPNGVDSVGTSFFRRKETNWESFNDWNELQVVLASRANGDFPCLMEGQTGRGRWVLSSLWLDKCFNAIGEPTQEAAAIEVSANLFASLCQYVHLVKQGKAPDVVPTQPAKLQAAGPMIGHVDSENARLWYRPAEVHQGYANWVCELSRGDTITRTEAVIDGDHDFTLHFNAGSLIPDTEYAYRIFPVDEERAWSEGWKTQGSFRTRPTESGSQDQVILGLGSCAPSVPDPIWSKILEEGCQGFVFLGDTPYVDSDQLSVARAKHREFLRQPEIAAMIRQIPCWGTWDDHDFGKNDGHGDFSGKHIARIAFTEYRANRNFGQDSHGEEQVHPFGEGRGIHTSFRFGPIEVFLLDPRWFSRTASSWADPSKPTCLGRHQWEWFREKLRSSDATYKAITTGMIWDDKKNSEKDDWETYSHERQAIFDLIRNEKIPGCFLIGGDIHVSRALHYGNTVGYPLWQFIISPMHGSTIPSLNVPHPALVHSAVEPHVFLKLVADEQQLRASWINREGKRIFEVELSAAELRPSD